VYTQCSKCETVFTLSAEVLRTAGGQVRCGKCGEVFNALARLAEDSNAFATGESPLELETRADSILESVGTAPDAQETDADNEEFERPGVEIARIEILDWPDDNTVQTTEDDRSLEFTLPPGELDRIFVESKKTARRVPPSPQPVPVPQALPQPAPQSAPPPSPPEPPPQPQPQPRSPHESVPQTPTSPPPHPESVRANVAPARIRGSGFEVPEEVRRAMLAGFEQHLLLPTLEPNVGALRESTRRPLAWWLSGAIAAALLLCAQIVHQNREWFVSGARGSLGVAVTALYGAIGSPLPTPSNLTAYQLRQWGVAGDPAANGTLRLRASILNAAAQLQPYPLLRVTLADRFGKSIGRRDFEPSEYMGRPTARLLAPGERVDATLEILDPGKNAEGFEIDVCVRGADRRVACANDVAAQAKP
jgi:predicted Zn finger-like uncharacterized protein